MFANLQDLKWKEVTIETVRKSIARWKKRLNAVKQNWVIWQLTNPLDNDL